MTGDQFKPIDKPYYRQWQKGLETLQKPTKPSKAKPHKKGKKKAKQ